MRKERKKMKTKKERKGDKEKGIISTEKQKIIKERVLGGLKMGIHHDNDHRNEKIVRGVEKTRWRQNFSVFSFLALKSKRTKNWLQN